MVDGVCVNAPCKLNIHLQVLRLRADGYHGILSLFQKISLSDRITIRSLKENGICALSGAREIPNESNTIMKAVTAFRRVTGIEAGLAIELEKRVPIGAGLGGGSSDAVATLLALDRLFGTALGEKGLYPICVEIGSDLPFFLSGGCAIVSGRGEFLEETRGREDYVFVVANPGYESRTKAAYGALDEAGGLSSDPEPDAKAIIDAYGKDPKSWPFFNSFFPVLRKKMPELDELLSALKRTGAEFAGLSGSGSSVFGLFLDEDRANYALRDLSASWPFVEKAYPLAVSEVGV